jgi:hypothetical protein
MYSALAVVISGGVCFLIGVVTGYLLWRTGAKMDAEIKAMKEKVNQ